MLYTGMVMRQRWFKQDCFSVDIMQLSNLLLAPLLPFLSSHLDSNTSNCSSRLEESKFRRGTPNHGSEMNARPNRTVSAPAPCCFFFFFFRKRALLSPFFFISLRQFISHSVRVRIKCCPKRAPISQ